MMMMLLLTMLTASCRVTYPALDASLSQLLTCRHTHASCLFVLFCFVFFSLFHVFRASTACSSRCTSAHCFSSSLSTPSCHAFTHESGRPPSARRAVSTLARLLSESDRLFSSIVTRNVSGSGRRSASTKVGHSERGTTPCVHQMCEGG